MAFRTKKHMRRGFRRRRSPYELAQISICRSGLETGLSSCDVPDQFFTPLIVAKTWQAPLMVVTGAGVSVENALPSHEEKDLVVRGIQFDYNYTVLPGITANVEEVANGTVTIRSAVVVMEAGFQGSGGQFDAILPGGIPSSNILHHSEALRTQGEASDSTALGTSYEGSKHYRILWRGLDVVNTNVQLVGAGSLLDSEREFETGSPIHRLQSRHVRIRTGARLGKRDAIFFVTESVNPFLTQFPTLGLDLLGSLVVKSARRGNRYDT